MTHSIDIERILTKYSIGAEKVPVDFEMLLARLGMGPILFRSDVSGHGALVVENDKASPVVRVEMEGTPTALNQRQRFTVAHEVAHELFSRELLALPRRAREYWDIERLCNEFAGRLLVPDYFLATLAKGVRNSSSLISAMRVLASRCAVSLETSARRLSDVLPNVGIMAVKRVETKTIFTLTVQWAVGEQFKHFARLSHLTTGEAPEVFGLIESIGANRAFAESTDGESRMVQKSGTNGWIIARVSGVTTVELPKN